MTLADLLAEQHDLLTERFADAARNQAKSAGLDRVELIDSMAFFLDDLVDALASGARIDREHSAAASHGVERLSIGFRVERVVQEYMLVAELILQAADERGYAPSTVEVRTLMEAVGEGAAIAASEYVRRREADLLQRESEHSAFLAHELRNSLTSARFAFDLLRRREFGDPESLVHIIDSGLREASSRIDGALAGARVRGGVVSPVRVFPRLMLEEIAAEVRPQAEARQIQIIIEGEQDLAGNADARLLRSALDNLTTNAVKFSRPGGTVKLSVAAHGGELRFEVADSCGGIDETRLERLFRPFEQASSERSGFGLGLAIARECAEAQGGKLELRNVPEIGCVFILSLPIQA
ncbi:MAG: sensor histidine kinase [Polyangia bacterium]